jgi:hypothetical protein
MAPKGKSNIVGRQAPGGSKPPGGAGGKPPGGGSGGAGGKSPGGGGGKGGGKEMTPEQTAKINEFKNKLKDYTTCTCKGTAINELVTCAAKACTDADAMSAVTTMVNKVCGSVEGFKPVSAPGGTSAPKMMS